MEELKNKSKEKEFDGINGEFGFDELDDELNELEESKFVKNVQNDFNKLKKYNIYFFLNVNKENTFIFPIQTDYFNINELHVYELIKSVVKKINEQKITITINSIKYIVSLKDTEDEDNMDFYIKNYEIKPCKKKNFMPKTDCPSFSSSALLKNIEKENISFVSKNNLNIMLLEKFDSYEPSSKYEIDDEEEF